MRKQTSLLLLLLLVVNSTIQVNALSFIGETTDTPDYYEVDNGSKLRFYKDLGYDRLLKPDGSVFVDKQTYTVEYLDGDQWVKVNTPYGISKDSDKITRKDSKNYTYVDTIYHVDTGKTDVVIDSGESRVYRIVWELSGINSLNYVLDDKGVNFTGATDWVYADWSDANTEYSYEATKNSLRVVFNVGYVTQGERYTLDPYLIDSYAEGNRDTYTSLTLVHPSAAAGYSAGGQSVSITGTNKKLGIIAFQLTVGAGAPTGIAHAVLYAHNGVYGTSSVPTGAALATSDDFDISTVAGGYALYNFTFSGANQYTMTAGTQYCLVLQIDTGGTYDATNYIRMGVDSTGAHSGNHFRYSNSAWGAEAARDAIFSLYGIGSPSISGCVSDSNFTKNNPHWINVTVADTGGIANLNYVDTVVTNTVSGNNFTLRWTQATSTFTEQSDIHNMCSLGPSYNVTINANTVKLAHNVTITKGLDGFYNVTVYVFNDDALNVSQLFADEFYYVTYSWNLLVYDLINSAFGLFGIPNYMQSAITFTNGITAHFTDSLLGLATLINLQFQVIWNTFGFFTNWATRIIDRAINLGERMRDIMNGVALGTEDVWAFFEFDTWAPDVVPLAAILYWIDSIYKRGPTQGYTTVLWGDLQNMANVFAFFIGAFSMVIGFIEDKVNWVIQALP